MINWITPKTDWKSTDTVKAEDINRIMNNMVYIANTFAKLGINEYWVIVDNIDMILFDDYDIPTNSFFANLTASIITTLCDNPLPDYPIIDDDDANSIYDFFENYREFYNYELLNYLETLLLKQYEWITEESIRRSAIVLPYTTEIYAGERGYI